MPVPPNPKQSVVATASTPPPKISISTFLNDAMKLDRHPMDVGNCRLVEHWSTGYCHVYSLGLAKKVSTETDAQCTERAELRNRMRQAIAERFCG